MDWFPFRNIKTSIQIAQFMRGHVKFIKKQVAMKKEIFDFSEALRRMKEGKKVRRVIWKECGAYIHIISETIVAVCDGKFFPCVFKDSEDILATDWEEV